jgi:predicted phage terminase large subunit-like protein
MHRWLARQLDQMCTARGLKLNLLGPRGGAKRTIGTLAFVLRSALEGREPYIWIVSDTKHQAIAHLENIKDELVGSEPLIEAYSSNESIDRGPAVAATLSHPTFRANRITLASGVAIEAFGTGQRIRGRRRRANRPTLIVCDDLENDTHITSAAARERSRNWFHGMLIKAGTRRTNIVNLATALHREALAMQLHATAGWTSRRFAAIEQWPARMDLWHEWEQRYTDLDNANHKADAREFYGANAAAMNAGAAVLWPEEEDLYTLMCMRVESGRTAFEREKQNQPVNPDLCEFPEEYFDGAIWFNEWPTDPLVTVIALDPSKGADARRGDYSAFVLVSVDRGGVIYVEADLARRPTPRIVEDGIELCLRRRPSMLGIEANQFQELLSADFNRAAAARGMFALGIVPIENHAPKAVRIRKLGPQLSARRLRFKSASHGTRLLVDQLREFPLAEHDDGPDALEMALRLADSLLVGRVHGDKLGSRLRISV